MPAQKIVTSVTRNKVQLINLIVASLTDDPILSNSCLILTGSQETPYKIQDAKMGRWNCVMSSEHSMKKRIHGDNKSADMGDKR